MTTPITRAADRHLTLAALHEAKPKPTKEAKKKRVPVEKRRKKLEKQIEDIIKLIIFWRDGQVCVMGNIDGGRCGNGLMWSHVIAQKQSSWLKLDLGNVVCGCGNHNLLDFRGDKTLTLWYCQTIGVEALQVLQHTARLYSGTKRTEEELELLLAHYDNLYQNRFTVDLDLQSLIKAGFYGEIVRLVRA
jgi:hypothetical protein